MASTRRRRIRVGATQTLGGHLRELRRRAMIAAAAILVASVVGWFLADGVWALLRDPILTLARAEHRNASINYSSLTSAFDIRIQVAVFLGVILASPVWLYQVFAFLMPGLTRREGRYTLGFFFSALPLFIGGCAAGWLVVPHIVAVLLSFVPLQDASLVEASDYLGFVVKLIVAIGVAFVSPVFLVLLNFAGVLSARSIIHGWRVATIVIFVFCAIATPSADVASMFLLAAPMIVLYLAAAGISAWHDAIAARQLRSPAAVAHLITTD